MIHSNPSDKGEGIVLSRLKELVAQKERQIGRKILQKEIAEATALTEHTIGRWMEPTPFDRLETKAVRRLCKFLDCQIGDLLYIDYSQN